MILYNNTYVNPAFKWALGKAKEPGHKKQEDLNSAMLTFKTIEKENTIRLSNRRNQSVVKKKHQEGSADKQMEDSSFIAALGHIQTAVSHALYSVLAH